MSALRGKGALGKVSAVARLRMLPRYLRDRRVSGIKKTLIALIALYIVSPLDLVPEIVLPFIGWLDDLGLLGAASLWLYRELGEYEENRRRERSKLPR